MERQEQRQQRRPLKDSGMQQPRRPQMQPQQTQRPPVNDAGARSNTEDAHNKTLESVKHPGVLFTVFVAVLVVAVAIIAIQLLKEPSDGDIMDLFVTTPQEYDTSILAAVNQGEGNMLAYPAVTEATKALEIQSSHGILINLRNNTVIADKNGSERMYPASMTKIMTLIVAYENVKDLDAKVTISAKIVDDAYLAGASVAGFKAGEQVTVRDLLYGTILPSGADATSALAEYVAGDETTFAAMMNKKAKEIGMMDSHFVTASGLHDDDHYSTCRDMALALKYAIATPYLREILGTYTYTTTPTPEHPEGIMLFSTMYKKMEGDEADGVYIQGGKTGYTPEAHNCLASFAARCSAEHADEFDPQFILVTGGGIGEYAAIYDAIDVYERYTK
ncbi:MAG: D-alanyl-D-alanine carboxypeptidase [Clostridia bacterium]|nr:D-alanyl-D-alanine carboxypeptidase [Clostridia bacterium]